MMNLTKIIKIKLNKKSVLITKNLRCGDITSFSESSLGQAMDSVIIRSQTSGYRVIWRTFSYLFDKCIVPNVCT